MEGVRGDCWSLFQFHWAFVIRSEWPSLLCVDYPVSLSNKSFASCYGLFIKIMREIFIGLAGGPPIYLPIYLFIYLCIYVSIYLCIYVSMYLCIYVSIYLSKRHPSRLVVRPTD